MIAPVEIKEGVDTEVEDRSLVAERVSVEKVRSASSERSPAVEAKVTLPDVRAELVMAPPERVVYVASPRTGVIRVGEVASTREPEPVWLVVVRAVPPLIESEVPTANVPVKLAVLEIVWPLMRPEAMVLEPRFKAPEEVIAPRVESPAVRTVAKRLVLDAVVEKRLVVVALVPVAFAKVKFWRVDEPLRRRLEKVERPAVSEPMLAEVEKRLVLEAVPEKSAVVVAFVVVELPEISKLLLNSN